MLEQGILKSITQTLMSDSKELVINSAWICGNLAGDSIQNRNEILAAGIIPAIVKIADESTDLDPNLVWAIGNMIKGRPVPDLTTVKEVLRLFPKILEMENIEILSDSMSILASISNEETYIDLVFSTNSAPKLIYYLRHPHIEITNLATKAIGNIIMNSSKFSQQLISYGILDQFVILINHPRKSIKKEVIFSLSNLLADEDEIAESILDHEIIKNIIKLLSDSDEKVKEHALWAIGNASHRKNKAIVKRLEKYGVLGQLVQLLKYPNPKIIISTLCTLDNILDSSDISESSGLNKFAIKFEESGGLDIVESLQNNPSLQVYTRAVKFMMKFYGVEQENDENVNGETSSFVFS